VYTALQTGLSVAAGPFSLRTQCRRVDPDYQSMGVSSVGSDVFEVSATSSLRLFRGAVQMSGDINHQVDNITGTKLATTRMLNWSGSLAVEPVPSFGFAANYANGLAEATNALPGKADSGRVQTRSNTAGFSPHASFNNSFANHSLSASYNVSWQEYVASEPLTYTPPLSHTVSSSYQFMLVSTGLSLSPSVTFSRTTGQPAAADMWGASLGASQSFFGGVLATSLSPSVSWSSGGDGGRYISASMSAGFGLSLLQRHSFNGDVGVSTSAAGAAQTRFWEVRLSAGYSFSF
jgi:hypothetical protein